VHAVFVGDALFRGDASYEDELHRRAAQLGVRDRAHFLGFRDDIPTLMRAVDIVVHASTEPEPFGRVIVEGMLARRPVIAARAGGAQEIITHEENGLLTSPGDARQLAQAIDRVQSHRGWAEQLAENGRSDGLRRFSVDQMVSGVRDVVRAVSGSRTAV
jgi:glycosyltransferase involved in cell wall biosynthesis